MLRLRLTPWVLCYSLVTPHLAGKLLHTRQFKSFVLVHIYADSIAHELETEWKRGWKFFGAMTGSLRKVDGDEVACSGYLGSQSIARSSQDGHGDAMMTDGRSPNTQVALRDLRPRATYRLQS